jgi:alpha-ribazole phosphatase
MWRHPRPIGAAGRCIGRTDLDVDRRRVKHLAHRITDVARRERLPRVVWTSPARRCAEVGRLLRAHGFVHRIDERLWELDFGAWDGRAWSAIGRDEVGRWEAEFEHHRPGGGESLATLIARARGFLAERISGGAGEVLVVGHAGWMTAARWPAHESLCATRWPQAMAYNSMTRCCIDASGSE